LSGWTALVLGVVLPLSACNWNANLGSIGDGPGSVLWKATFETGDLSEWSREGPDHGGAYVDNPTNAGPRLTSSMPHRGRWAAEFVVVPNASKSSVSYLYRQQPSPRAAYYSAWFYVPGNIAVPVGGFLSLSHFRGNTAADGTGIMYAAWDINLYTMVNGLLAAQMYDFKENDTQQTPPVMPFPTDQWVQLEVFMAKATPTDASTPTGRITVWQDGVQILDRQDVATVMSDFLQWDVGGTSNNLQPSPSSIYLDDAAISVARLGPDSTL
jgi:hypothetical protein